MEQGEIGSRGKQLMMGVVLEDSEEFLVSIIKQMAIYELSVLTGIQLIYCKYIEIKVF